MMNLTVLCRDVFNLVEDFAGVADKWKHRFTTDVLPKIDQGWAIVGNANGGIAEYMPCANCYMYGSEGDLGMGGLCINCSYDEEVTSTFVNFKQIRDSTLSFRNFETFEDFQRYRVVYMNSEARLSERMLEESAVFRQIRMLGLV
jgi:hypothetical protein